MSEEEICKKPRMDETMIKIAVKWSNMLYNIECDPVDDIAILK